MLEIFENLEIRTIKIDDFIFKDLDECESIIFVQEGRYKIGYEINKKINFILEFG